MGVWGSIWDGVKDGLRPFHPVLVLTVLAISYLPAWVSPPPDGGHWAGIMIAVVVITLAVFIMRLFRQTMSRTPPLASATELLAYSASGLTFAFVLILIVCVGVSAILFSLASVGSSLVPFSAIGRAGALLFVLLQVASAVLYDFVEVFELQPEAFRFSPTSYPLFSGLVVVFRAAMSSAVFAAILAPYAAYRLGKKVFRTVDVDGQRMYVDIRRVPPDRVEEYLAEQIEERRRSNRRIEEWARQKTG